MRTVLAWLALNLILILPGAAQAPWPPQTFTCYYGKIEADTPQQLANFDLLIVHPGDDGQNLDPAKVAKLRFAGKPKTLVGYISIGEDSASPGGPPLQGQDGSGPTFVGKDLKVGLAGLDYPAYFMDQRQLVFDDSGFPRFGPNGRPTEQRGQDGHPDENGVWGSYYAKADDPVWQAKVFERLEHLDSLDLDGFFLDTVDTASPWGDFGWTSSAMLDLVEKIRARYPDKKIVANRGLFYLGQSDRYAKAIDAVLFESLLTGYREETKSAGVNPWARWHVQALLDDVAPSLKRTGLTLLVLDYLEPEHPDAPLLVQSARTLLKDTPHCLTFSHPSLRIPGWPVEQLLTDPVAPAWPAITGIELQKEEMGAFTIEVAFDGPIPAGAMPDLRVTSRTDIVAERAAELPLTWVMSYQPNGAKALVQADGLDKGSTYRLFFRLISKSPATQSPFAWTTISTAPSDLPGQVTDLSSDSHKDGLLLSFTAKSSAQSFRIYTLDASGARRLLQEAPASPVTLAQAPVGSALEVMVTAVDQQGREGYASHPHVAVRRNVTPPAAPGPVSISGSAALTTFHWTKVAGAKTYRLYAVPEGRTYRLPLVCKESEATVKGARKGVYRVFATSVDKDGNQSQPGPSVTWKAQ
jgi:hypothetical protein